MTPRTVLLITYYYPPSGGPGVQRALKFSKYLPDLGWRVVVLTVDPSSASYPDLDPTLAEEVPGSVRVERTRAWDGFPSAVGAAIASCGTRRSTWSSRPARPIRRT